MLMISKIIFKIIFFTVLSFFVLPLCLQRVQCQDINYIALVPPLLDPQHRDDIEGSLQLVRQDFVIFLYQNAAVVYTDAHFINSGTDPLEMQIGLPSTGYTVIDEKGMRKTSNGILGVQLWAEEERSEMETTGEGDAEWYITQATFMPQQETNIKAMFWVQTSLTDCDSVAGLEKIPITPGQRSILIPLNQTAMWKDDIHSIHVTVVAKNGVASSTAHLSAQPDTYDNVDSRYTWVLWDVEPSTFDDISVEYVTDQQRKTKLNTMEKLSRYILETGYNELMEYVSTKLEK
jgi:hypothetical protein